MSRALSEHEEQQVYERCMAWLRNRSSKGMQDRTAEGLVVLLSHLWEYRHEKDQRKKNTLAAMIKNKFPDLRDPGEFSKRRTRKLEDLLNQWTQEVREASPSANVSGMTLYRSKGHEPPELRFALYEPIGAQLSVNQTPDDFETFWLPYRKPQVETKIILGQPAFLSNGKSHSRRFEPSIERSAPDKLTKSRLVFPYVRSWDFVSALKLQNALLGIDHRSSRATAVITPERVTIESSMEYDPLDDHKQMNLRSYNIIAFGYPRDNAVLRSYQERKGLSFRVLPDNDHTSAGETKPRVTMSNGKTLTDQVTGEPRHKFCVLTRRFHTNQSNTVTMIAGNSSRAVAEVIDGLTFRDVCNTFFRGTRRSLVLKDRESLPNEFQIVFSVEFTSQKNNDVRVELCERVPADEVVLAGSPLSSGRRAV